MSILPKNIKPEEYLGKGIEYLVFALVIILIILGTSIFGIFSNDLDIGNLGSYLSGTIGTVVALLVAIFTFLAFYVQYDANKKIQNQIDKKEIEDFNQFEYNKFKERINLILSEVNNFKIAFHKGSLIKQLNGLEYNNGKKYNFSGIQGLNLFLVEYFRIKEKAHLEGSAKFNIKDSHQSIMLHVNNLIVLFFNTHIEIKDSKIPEKYRNELNNLLTYLYHSKMSYLCEHFNNNEGKSELNDMIITLKLHYNSSKEK